MKNNLAYGFITICYNNIVIRKCYMNLITNDIHCSLWDGQVVCKRDECEIERSYTPNNISNKSISNSSRTLDDTTCDDRSYNY